MSITIVRTRNIGRPRLCYSCGREIIIGTKNILDIQDNSHKKYYHPRCFPHEKTEQMYHFWNDTHTYNMSNFNRGVLR